MLYAVVLAKVRISIAIEAVAKLFCQLKSLFGIGNRKAEWVDRRLFQ